MAKALVALLRRQRRGGSLNSAVPAQTTSKPYIYSGNDGSCATKNRIRKAKYFIHETIAQLP